MSDKCSPYILSQFPQAELFLSLSVLFVLYYNFFLVYTLKMHDTFVGNNHSLNKVSSEMCTRQVTERKVCYKYNTSFVNTSPTLRLGRPYKVQIIDI